MHTIEYIQSNAYLPYQRGVDLDSWWNVIYFRYTYYTLFINPTLFKDAFRGFQDSEYINFVNSTCKK